MYHEPEDAYIAALAMVDLFASVGVDRFDVTLTELFTSLFSYIRK